MTGGVPGAFVAAVVVRTFDLGPGGYVIRTEHPELPGDPVIGLLDRGMPPSALTDKIASCIVELHQNFQQKWSL